MKHQTSADRCDPSRSMFSPVGIGPELQPKLINISFLVLKEVVCILNCAFAHESTSTLMFSAVSTGPNLQHKLINTPFSVLKVSKSHMQIKIELSSVSCIQRLELGSRSLAKK